MPSKPVFYSYGWVPDLPDHRDHAYAAPRAVVERLPSRVDLRALCPPVYTQGRIGSCTAQAIAAAMQFARRKEKHTPDFVPSRLFIYWNERNLEHTVPLDNGAQLRDGIKVVNQLGVCPESFWPYDDTPADRDTGLWPKGALPAARPSRASFADAENFQAIGYQRLPRSLSQLKGCLASGFPFVLGFAVYEGFERPETARTGRLDMPDARESFLGGHAVLAVGYDDSTQRFIARNSWSARWGMKGYFTMPYAYLLEPNLSDDFWTIRIVE